MQLSIFKHQKINSSTNRLATIKKHLKHSAKRGFSTSKNCLDHYTSERTDNSSSLKILWLHFPQMHQNKPVGAVRHTDFFVLPQLLEFHSRRSFLTWLENTHTKPIQKWLMGNEHVNYQLKMEDWAKKFELSGFLNVCYCDNNLVQSWGGCEFFLTLDLNVLVQKFGCVRLPLENWMVPLQFSLWGVGD